MSATLRTAHLIAFGVPAALLGGAYLSQYGFGLHPCEMCLWQRWPHFAALAFASLALAVPARRWLLALAAGGMATSGLIGGYHAGIEYGWWDGLSACTTLMVPEGGNALDAIMEAPMIRCDQAPWSFLGISLAGWNFLISLAAAATVAYLLARSGNEKG